MVERYADNGARLEMVSEDVRTARGDLAGQSSADRRVKTEPFIDHRVKIRQILDDLKRRDLGVDTGEYFIELGLQLGLDAGVSGNVVGRPAGRTSTSRSVPIRK